MRNSGRSALKGLRLSGSRPHFFMAFSVGIEMLNLRMRAKADAAKAATK